MSEQSGSGRERDRGRTGYLSGYQKRKKKQKQEEQGKKEQAKMRRLDQFYLTKNSFLAECDPFLSQHIQKNGNQGNGHVSYFSSSICEQFINLMGKEVLPNIVEEVKSLIHYSISVDYTPDITHIDQLAVTIRCVKATGPVERFLTFVLMYGHTGTQIAELLLKFLSVQGIPIERCRGQSYDNASNMSGKYNGVQSIIRSRCPNADYVPCTAHSLNKSGGQTCIRGLFSWSCNVQFYSECLQFFFGIYCSWAVLTKHLEGLPVDKSL